MTGEGDKQGFGKDVPSCSGRRLVCVLVDTPYRLDDETLVAIATPLEPKPPSILSLDKSRTDPALVATPATLAHRTLDERMAEPWGKGSFARVWRDRSQVLGRKCRGDDVAGGVGQSEGEGLGQKG